MLYASINNTFATEFANSFIPAAREKCRLLIGFYARGKSKQIYIQFPLLGCQAASKSFVMAQLLHALQLHKTYPTREGILEICFLKPLC